MNLVSSVYKELQDFNDIHKKIKAKIQDDIKYYNKFIEVFLELSMKHNQFEAESSEIINYFLKKLGKVIKKLPFLFKNAIKPIQSNLLKMLAKSSLNQVFQVIIDIPFFLNIYFFMFIN